MRAHEQEKERRAIEQHVARLEREINRRLAKLRRIGTSGAFAWHRDGGRRGTQR